MKSYSVYFHDRANQGSFAIDAIAATVQGDWTSSTDNSAIITVTDDNAEYLKELLDQDEKVESYRER
jgi:hypothetical protein